MPMPILLIVMVSCETLPGATGLGANCLVMPTLDRLVSVALVGSTLVAPWVVITE